MTIAADSIPGLLDRLAANRHTPIATYRLQFNRNFTFEDARRKLAYLHTLGVSDVYASPYLKAAPGSMHGYDIVDHCQLNPEIGSQEDYERFVATLHAEDMRQILDIVPNHMGIGPGNAWWMNVLEDGPSSQYARFFDIDWHPPRPEMANKVLLPILGDQFGRVLDRGEFQLVFEDGAFSVHYYEHRFPIAPGTCANILRPALERSARTLAAGDDKLLELQSVITAIGHLPPQTETDAGRLAELYRERLIIRRRLQNLCATESTVCDAIEESVRQFNGNPGVPSSFDRLADLLEHQAYRLSYWRVAAEEINYRRFFDVNGLAALRIERSEVFAATHRLVLRLLVEGKLAGLRIDHPDGLRDPEEYFERLQSHYAALTALRAVDGERSNGCADDRVEQLAGEIRDNLRNRLEDRPGAIEVRPLYTVVEKILSHGERLPAGWATDGTTGYDFLNQLNGIFVDSSNRKVMDSIYSSFTGNKTGFRELAYEAKKLIMRSVLASEVNVLSLQLSRVAARNRWYRDFTLNLLTAAIVEVIACFPIYRTYIDPVGRRVSERDRLYIDLSVDRAKRLNPLLDPSIFDFIQNTLTLEGPNGQLDAVDEAQADFVLKFQQVSSPVMAKGVEDTAFYRYVRLVSLNEVGGDPEQFGVTLSGFHRQNAERQARRPYTMLATSTHDTKRSEDVRARINVLSEISTEWRTAARRWSRINRKLRQSPRGQPVPDRNDEYLLYQTLAGAWPLELLYGGDREAYAEFTARIQAYMEKAIREAKLHTSWINPNAAYEEGLRGFIAGMLADPDRNPFVQDAVPFIRALSSYGMYNSLSQTLVKLTCPGVPDTYQGTELWDFSLVDPDNRRPVDFGLRSRMLDALIRRLGKANGDTSGLARELLRHSRDGRIKMFITHCALVFRRQNSYLFAEGSAYMPLEATGSRAENVVSFLRRTENDACIVVAPRFVTRLTKQGKPPIGDVWGDTVVVLRGEVPGQRYRDVYTGAILTANERDGAAVLQLADMLRVLPVLLAERLSDDPGSDSEGAAG